VIERRVEIIDDDVDFANALGDFLELNGYTVQTAHDGAGAHALMREFEPEVALVDLRLGRDSGLDVIPRLKRDRPHLTCVIVTAFAEIETAVEALRQGAYEYLRKPLYNDEVLAVLDRCFEKRHLELDKEAAEAALGESEERFRTLSRISPVGVYHTDAQGNPLYVNEKWCEIAGMSAAAAVGAAAEAGWTQALHPDDRDRVIAERRAAVEEKRPFVSEYRFQRPDGTVAWLLGQAAGQIGENGETVGYVGTITDISELKTAQDKLRENQALLTGLVDHMPATVQVKDGEGRYLLGNQRFMDLFDVSSDELLGKTSHDFYPAELADGFEAHDREVLKTGETSEREIESTLIRQDGSKIALWATKFAIPGPDGTPVAVAGINIDITERKRSENALRESEALLTGLVENMLATVQVKDREGRYLLVNQRFADVLGVSPDEILGKTAHDFYPADIADKFEAHDREVLETGTPSELEIESTLANRDGSKLFYSSTKIPIPGPDGSPAALAGINIDITERKRTENALRENEALLKALVDHIPASVQVKDGKGRYVLVNQLSANRFDLSSDELLGKTAHDFYPTDVADKYEAHDKEVMKTGEISAREYESFYLRPDGSKMFIWATKFPIPGPDGAPAAVGGLKFDITERMRAEEALRESEALNRAVLESVVDGIISIDESGTIQSLNPAAERIFGYRPDEVVDRNVKLLMPEPYHSEHDGYLARYLDTGEARIIGIGREVEGRRKDGSVFPLDLAVSNLPQEGKRLFIGVIRDITERKVAEEALQRAHDELEARVEERTRELTVEIAERWRIEAALRAAKEAAETANRAKSEFLAAMSHELRTPLNAVLGFAEVLKTSPDVSLGEKQEGYLDIIMESGGHLLDLINDLLDVSAIEAGKLELSEENVDVARLMESSVQLVRARAERGQVGLSVAIPETELFLHADERRMKQILLNLLSNAVKFTPEGGDVSLDVRVADDGSMVFSISDTGIGMDKAGLAQAMTMFGQVDGSLARQYEGAGLGLPLTLRLVESHGGTLKLDSRPDVGTTATVRIPAHRVVDLPNKD